MSDVTIPAAALEAACKAYELYIYDCVSDDAMRLAIAAALNAWPGMGLEYRSDNPRFYNGNLVILPLPQEASDD